MMVYPKWFCLLVLLTPFFVGSALGDIFIYPNKGQSQEQQERGKFECHSWAVRNSGFDPMKRPTASTPPPAREAPQGGVGRGAFRGAALGAAIGGISKKGKAGRGAAIGALGGTMIGGMRRRDQRRREQQAQQNWAAQESARYDQGRNTYDRAQAACLGARGYTVR